MKTQKTERKRSLEGRLRTAAELLELILNYLVFICAATAASAILGAAESPVWYGMLLIGLPFYYWFLRKKITRVGLFLTLHIPAAVLAGMQGFFLQHNRVFWIVLLIAGVIFYTVNSIYVRIKEKKQESIPAGMALGVSLLTVFFTSYVDYQEGTNRILFCSLLYVFLFLIRMYLKCMAEYLLNNKNAAGAMPEQAIVQLSIRNVLLQSAVAAGVITAVIRTPLADWLTQQAKNLGLLILRGIGFLISLIASDEPNTDVPLEESIPFMGQGAGAVTETVAETGWLVKLLNALFYVAGIGLGVTFLVAIFVMLARKLIEGFYENKEVHKEVFVEGFLEEEERIGKKKENRQAKIPVLGGTPQQKIRKIFWKTVLGETEKMGEQQPQKSWTARQFAEKFGTEKPGEWEELAKLYEKARYDRSEVTREDVRQASLLARRVKR